MKKFALVVLTNSIKVKEFEFKDDFDTARQSLITRGIKVIPLKWHSGANIWTQPETSEP
jgi:hypothetical protein